MEIGDFYYAKIHCTVVNEGYNKSAHTFKIRPVLIIAKKGKWFECLTITTKLKNNLERKNRIDIYTNYNFSQHSQIICGYSTLVKPDNLKRKIDHCRPDDFNCILNKHKRMLDIEYYKTGKR